ncbi:hypothetical protein SAMN02745945_01820 [Peptoclostridium litorale DSM 5388]|uniref:Uncharacterized protein n=1 Tax=Peptoclostridium litorale DSM 5388 TaxID=1121324 RepID=A0A069RFV8_PEPLI|nr:hypothetical protein [Peptoclostridium litorale]KDR95906.1 hypothetical protein CLIT_8c00750 [Peptoclostridium litorale DSM 5388]SIO10255.1 hypothetical protein SAMN02745945_01820 [Peptoclostridium litorale DSM 5388]
MTIKMLKTSASAAGVFLTDRKYEVGIEISEDMASSFIKIGAAVEDGKAVQLGKVDEQESPAEDLLVHKGAGWYELPNGEKIQGKDEALKRLEELKLK